MATAPEWYAESTHDTVTIRVYDKGSYSYFSYSLRELDDTIIAGPTAYSTRTSYTVTGLTPETSYYAYLSWSTSTTGEGNYDYVIVDTTAEPTSVDYWDWDRSNGSATATLTSTAYDAVRYGGAVSAFSYLVWNDLVDKAKEILDASGDTWNSRYTTYSGARMSSTSRILTADKFNSLRYNIGLRVSTGISEQSPGDPVLGSYFLTLADCLNKWIDQL